MISLTGFQVGELLYQGPNSQVFRVKNEVAQLIRLAALHPNRWRFSVPPGRAWPGWPAGLWELF